jgi:hypothetical protein
LDIGEIFYGMANYDECEKEYGTKELYQKMNLIWK